MGLVAPTLRTDLENQLFFYPAVGSKAVTAVTHRLMRTSGPPGMARPETC